jgi:PHP family Zn ribbon phosphoesterase
MPGLEYHKLDLHTHTPASKCYRFKEHTPEQIVQAALDRDLRAIAITDHNTAEWIDRIRAAAESTPLVVFPGVEISANEGFHVLAIFDPNTDQKHVESFLGAIGIKSEDYGQQECFCKKSIYVLLDTVHEHDGLAILAHIDLPKGAFYELSQKDELGKVHVPVTCSGLFNDARYEAVECANGRLPDGYDTDHHFKRVPAFYQASDNPDPELPTRHSLDGLGALFSWFKLDATNLEGLRQCFADPEVRIQLAAGHQQVGYPKIVSMRIGESGFLRNQIFEFHEGLNSVIGGKGVGKSLAIEFLRYGLDQVSNDPSLRDDHLSKLEKCLEPDNTVEVVYEVADGTHYRIRRTFLGKERVSDGYAPQSETQCVNLSTDIEYAGDVPLMFPILAYSQTEVIRIAENKEAQLQLIDRFIDTRQYEQEIAAVRAELHDNDRGLAGAIQARDQLASCERQISTLQEQIDSINKSLSNPLFDQMKQAENKRQAFEGQQSFVQRLIEIVRGWQTEVLGVSVDALPQAFTEDKDLQAQQATAEKARAQVLETLNKLVPKLRTANEAIGKGLEKWLPQFESVSQAYAQLLAEIGRDREAQERERKSLEKQKAKLDKEARGYQALIVDLAVLMDARSSLLDGLERAYRGYYEVRKAKFDQLTELSDGKLKLELAHAADRTAYEANLVELLRSGTNAPGTADRRQIAHNIAPRRFVQLVLDRNKPHLAEEAGISELWAGRVIEKLWSQDDFTEVLALQHNCYPADVPTIRFRKEGGQYDELSELSIGQKCTALLIVALCDGTMPVVIDQPEDALDVISVWEDITKKLRRGKNSRQFILTTHNSSVAVAADSDQFIVLKAGANYGRVEEIGAIDRADVKKAVIAHLEGGDEPYQLRAHKYNIQ